MGFWTWEHFIDTLQYLAKLGGGGPLDLQGSGFHFPYIFLSFPLPFPFSFPYPFLSLSHSQGLNSPSIFKITLFISIGDAGMTGCQAASASSSVCLPPWTSGRVLSPGSPAPSPIQSPHSQSRIYDASKHEETCYGTQYKEDERTQQKILREQENATRLPRSPGGPVPRQRLLLLLTSSLMSCYQPRPRPPAQSSSILPGLPRAPHLHRHGPRLDPPLHRHYRSARESPQNKIRETTFLRQIFCFMNKKI